MSKTSGADVAPKITQWTRLGLVSGGWSSYDSFDSLVFHSTLRAQLQKLAIGFLSSEDLCAKAKLAWRRGLFVYGPAGSGKSAAARAIALQLGWHHLTIPSYEILDAHHLARALFLVPQNAPAVVVIDNVDEILRRVDVTAFFDIFDQVSERASGVFWVATSRKPEDVPKAQLVRPGRFEEIIRITAPTSDVKKQYYENYLAPFLGDVGSAKLEHLALLEANASLSFAQLHEMRRLIIEILMKGEADSGIVQGFESFCQEQVIGGDRSGGLNAEAIEMEERVKHTDPRLLLSALQVTDAFKRVVEMTVTASAEAALALNSGSDVKSS